MKVKKVVQDKLTIAHLLMYGTNKKTIDAILQILGNKKAKLGGDKK